jgi:hypothetical protein
MLVLEQKAPERGAERLPDRVTRKPAATSR